MASLAGPGCCPQTSQGAGGLDVVKTQAGNNCQAGNFISAAPATGNGDWDHSGVSIDVVSILGEVLDSVMFMMALAQSGRQDEARKVLKRIVDADYPEPDEARALATIAQFRQPPR